MNRILGFISNRKTSIPKSGSMKEVSIEWTSHSMANGKLFAAARRIYNKEAIKPQTHRIRELLNRFTRFKKKLMQFRTKSRGFFRILGFGSLLTIPFPTIFILP